MRLGGFKGRYTVIAIGVAAVISVAMIALWLANMASDEPRVELVIIRHKPGPAPAKIQDFPFPELSRTERQQLDESVWKDPLSPTERQQLAELTGAGILEVHNGGSTGLVTATRRVKVVVVLRGPLGEERKFRLPADGTLFLLQEQGGWIEFPDDMKRSESSIVLSDHPQKSNGNSWIATRYMIWHSHGGAGGPALDWK
jgi:hypothetical protein